MPKQQKARWRKTLATKATKDSIKDSRAQNASKKAPFYLVDRLVAFVTDMFMINMPILYVSTYLVLGSKEAFLENQVAIFICVALFGIVLSIFFALKGQTPGYKYAGLRLINELDSENVSESNPSFLIAFLRYLLWIVSVASIVGVLIALFRKDSRTFYDVVCKTQVVSTKPTKLSATYHQI